MTVREHAMAVAVAQAHGLGVSGKAAMETLLNNVRAGAL